jgi:hypothetical protein
VTVKDNSAINFEWVEVGVSLASSEASRTIHRGETVTITAPAGLTYQWYVDARKVEGETGSTFVFNSAGKALGKYTISLWAGNNVGGNAIVITVTE